MRRRGRSISVSGSEELCQRCDFFPPMEVARFQTRLTEFTLFLECDVIAAGSGGRM